MQRFYFEFFIVFIIVGTILSAQVPSRRTASASSQRLSADTPMATLLGNTFIAPKGWSVRAQGSATILTAPEGDSWIALVDVHAGDPENALAAAWKAYKPEAKWPVRDANDVPDENGWSRLREYEYLTSPNEKRKVDAVVLYSGSDWIVVIEDLSQSVAEKRAGQTSVVFQQLLPKGYSRESFARKSANKLDSARIAELGRFIVQGQKELKIPGVALGLLQDGKVIFADGFGVKELGGSEKPDGDTLFMVASNTKPLTTLLLAKLVDDHRMTWATPVKTLFPKFRLGNDETTRSVQLKHLICACTGMPRQDLEWLFEFGKMTPDSSLDLLGTMQPTSKFGELFQYSNSMAAAAGYTAAYVLYPQIEVGSGYDRAMQLYVFDPLGMKATTFQFARALSASHATAHSLAVDGSPAKTLMALNYSIVPTRPSGGAWSSVHDMLKYVSMELAEGKLPDGRRYISSGPLLERRVPRVSMGKDGTYGMGLMVDTAWGVPVVHHGGDVFGYHGDMIWLPNQNVGAVVLTNGDLGRLLYTHFRRKLLEVLFDGRPEADRQLAGDAKIYFARLDADRESMTLPADELESAKLARHYANASLGEIAVSTEGHATVFDFGEWRSEVASRRNPDGTISFITTAPGVIGSEFVAGSDPKRTLTIRDAQHDYVFGEH